jgi:hypothetical protein
MASLADPLTVVQTCNPESPLLYSQRVAPEYRNRLVSNVVLAVSVIPFIVVGVQEVLGSL